MLEPIETRCLRACNEEAARNSRSLEFGAKPDGSIDIPGQICCVGLATSMGEGSKVPRANCSMRDALRYARIPGTDAGYAERSVRT